MDIHIIATTHMGYDAEKNEFDYLSGKTAGVCYMPGSFEDLLMEDKSKTEKRVLQTKLSGHHSVFDHNNISMYLSDIPKILAMIINNEHQYTTSEKSARYTKMQLTAEEQLCYDKWLKIFAERITKKYKLEYPQFFTDSRIQKLAQENARYLISVFTPTSMVYTTSYRQFNYLISFLDKFIEKTNKNEFEKKLLPCIQEFVGLMKQSKYYDDKLCGNEKSRELSLFARNEDIEEYFGDVYATTYTASFAELAQAQRHRTIYYSMKVLKDQYYIPPIIKDNADLTELWLSDIKSLGNIYPQATMLKINEMGTFDAFVLKMKERKCTFAQLEINQVTNATLKKYVESLKIKSHPRAEELMQYTKGSRCTFPDFKCTSPCGFALGINETRLI